MIKTQYYFFKAMPLHKGNLSTKSQIIMGPFNVCIFAIPTVTSTVNTFPFICEKKNGDNYMDHRCFASKCLFENADRCACYLSKRWKQWCNTRNSLHVPVSTQARRMAKNNQLQYTGLLQFIFDLVPRQRQCQKMFSRGALYICCIKGCL